MAVNLANKYQKQIDQQYTKKSISKAAFGMNYDFIGVKTASIFTLTSQAWGDYARTGANRYGTPSELQDTVQELSIARDRSFSITVDKGNYIQGNLVKTKGRVLKIQMEEQFYPELDTYNFGVLAASASTAGQVVTTAVTASNAYEMLLDGGVALDDNLVPEDGRIAFVSPSYYKFIKLDNSFILASELGMNTLIKGQVGEVDGVKIVKVNTGRLPANTAFLLTHPSANVAPMQLEDYNSKENPPGISGLLCEGRVIHDAFTQAQKVGANYQHKIA